MDERPAALFRVDVGARVKLCEKCSKPMAWITTAAGRRMPVDLHLPIVLSAGDDGGGFMVLRTAEGFHGLSHFATCPDADSFRKPRTGA